MGAFTLSGTFPVQALLVSVRLLPLLVVMPVAVFARVPVLVRSILALALAAVLAAGLPSDPSVSLSPATLAGEFLCGMVMAFGLHVAAGALDTAGRLLDTQLGLNAAGVFDPATSNVVGLMADLLSLALLLLFVALDMHLVLLRAVARVLALVPPGHVLPARLLGPGLFNGLGRPFVAALMLASPVVLGLWLTDVVFAVLSRSMPQANVYFLALPVKLAVGFSLLVLSLPLLLQGMSALFLQALTPAALLGAAP